MTLKSYLLIMLLGTVLAWGLVVYILFSVDPFSTNIYGLALFYSTFFLAASGTAALAGFVIRFILFKQALAFRLVTEAFRQSFLFAFLLVSALFLLSKSLFTWMNIFLLTVLLSAMEFFIASWQKGRGA